MYLGNVVKNAEDQQREITSRIGVGVSKNILLVDGNADVDMKLEEHHEQEENRNLVDCCDFGLHNPAPKIYIFITINPHFTFHKIIQLFCRLWRHSIVWNITLLKKTAMAASSY